ncbi:MAG: hypothetical protein HUK03_01965 [Bacteroidaceae bacterium]|nr:hypothetical protein [Bacteroidaceae bacterium]
MKKHLLLSISMTVVFAHAQSSLTLDGFAEMAGMTSCDNRMTEKNIYAIGALTYNISKGWSATIEAEFDQKEFALTQLFVSKEFADYANLSLGQITVPIGHTVPYNRPENHLTVFLPESEGNMMPYHWDQLGVSFHGERKGFSYNAMCLIDKGGMAGAARLDNTQVDGLRIGVSGYYGKTYLYQFDNDSLQYDRLGNLLVAGIDYAYEDCGIVARGYVTYSHSKGGFGHNAVCAGTELGFDVFSGKTYSHRLFPFVRYDYYNTAISGESLTIDKRDTHRVSAGISYQPLPHVLIKAEYARYQRQGVGGENMIMLGVAVSGFIKRSDCKNSQL